MSSNDLTISIRSLSKERMPALDGLRGIAILMVMGLHFFGYGGAESYLQRLIPVVGAVLTKVLLFGYAGVDLFFVLSGFLITGILLDSKGRPHRFTNFYARRVLRIFPLYYGTLVAVFVVLPLVHPLRSAAYQSMQAHQAWFWLYSSNLLSFVNYIPVVNETFSLAHFWSLCVEEHFYFIWPLLVFTLSSHAILRVAGTLMVVALACRAVLFMYANHWIAAGFSLSRADALAIGAIAAILVRGFYNDSRMRWYSLAVFWLTLPLVLLIIAMPRRLDVPAMEVCKYSVLAFFFGAVVLLAAIAERTTMLRKVLANRALVFFGKYSYGLYVFHGLLQPLFTRWFNADRLALTFHSDAAVCGMVLLPPMAISVAVALASWCFFERWFIAMKRFFEFRESATTNHAPAMPAGI